jgi:hypothetical protein
MKRVITVQIRLSMKRGATQQEVREFIKLALRNQNGLQPQVPVETNPEPAVRIVQLDTTYTKE